MSEALRSRNRNRMPGCRKLNHKGRREGAKSTKEFQAGDLRKNPDNFARH